jgi:hypothetical protein
MNQRQLILYNLRRGAAVITAVLFFSTGLLGATLDDYKAKIDSARTLASEIEDALRNDEFDQTQASTFVDTIRRDFPPAERIEWHGGSVEASNEWLLERTAAFAGETDPGKGLSIIVSIREYLSAVSFKLTELQQPSATSRTKDEDKQKLAEILRREEYQKPQPAKQSAFQQWLLKLVEWLANIWPKPKMPGQGLSGMESLVFVLRILLYAALLALLAFLVFKIAPLLVPNLKRTRKPKKKTRVILGEHIAEDETASDLLGDAEKLAREGNTRGAIRKGYIALLCDLGDRKIIGLARNKTNRDYLRDVRSRRELHPRMKSVTETFERHWYGFQESDEQDWVRFREEYRQTVQSI